MKVTVTENGGSSGGCMEPACGCLVLAIALVIVAGALKSCGF